MFNIFIACYVGHLPIVGESLDFQGLRFEVIEADERRVSRVKIHTAIEAAEKAESVAAESVEVRK